MEIIGSFDDSSGGRIMATIRGAIVVHRILVGSLLTVAGIIVAEHPALQPVGVGAPSQQSVAARPVVDDSSADLSRRSAQGAEADARARD